MELRSTIRILPAHFIVSWFRKAYWAPDRTADMIRGRPPSDRIRLSIDVPVNTRKRLLVIVRARLEISSEDEEEAYLNHDSTILENYTTDVEAERTDIDDSLETPHQTRSMSRARSIGLLKAIQGRCSKYSTTPEPRGSCSPVESKSGWRDDLNRVARFEARRCYHELKSG